MEIWRNGEMIEVVPEPTEHPESDPTTEELAENAYINSELALALIEELEG